MAVDFTIWLRNYIQPKKNMQVVPWRLKKQNIKQLSNLWTLALTTSYISNVWSNIYGY